jgi:hypothetical protein
VLEEAGLDAYVKEQMLTFEHRFSEKLNQGKSSGELAPEFQVELAAQIIVTYLQGFFRVIHLLKSREEMWRQVDALLTSLGL